jgi:hypothetical protein
MFVAVFEIDEAGKSQNRLQSGSSLAADSRSPSIPRIHILGTQRQCYWLYNYGTACRTAAYSLNIFKSPIGFGHIVRRDVSLYSEFILDNRT